MKSGYRTDRFHDEAQFTADLDAILAARPVSTGKYYGSPLNAFHDWMAETLRPETVTAIIEHWHSVRLVWNARPSETVRLCSLTPSLQPTSLSTTPC